MAKLDRKTLAHRLAYVPTGETVESRLALFDRVFNKRQEFEEAMVALGGSINGRDFHPHMDSMYELIDHLATLRTDLVDFDNALTDAYGKIDQNQRSLPGYRGWHPNLGNL